jgi:hypothetical protein
VTRTPEPELGQDAGQDLDLSAAGLRADGGELRISLEVLASKLEQSLPARTRVRRRGGGLLRRSEGAVRELEVKLGVTSYALVADSGGLQCTRQREVGGISIKREPMDPGAWVAALTADLRDEAQRSAQAREALTRLLA